MILPLLSCQFSTHQKPAPHLPHRHTMHAGDRYALFYPTDARGIKKLAFLVTYCYFRSVTAFRQKRRRLWGFSLQNYLYRRPDKRPASLSVHQNAYLLGGFISMYYDMFSDFQPFATLIIAYIPKIVQSLAKNCRLYLFSMGVAATPIMT